MELSERRKKILQVVVDDYIADMEPVSSKKVQEKHLREISSATVRNELAALEDLGFLAHPHTSAGKVPLPRAYRYYVDKLMERGKLTSAEIDYIQRHFNSNFIETETLVKNAAKVISDITNYTGVGFESQPEENIQNIKLVPLSEKTVLLIVVTETKVLKDSILFSENPIDEVYVETGAEILKNLFCGKKISEAVRIGEEVIEREFSRYRALFKNIIEVFKQYINCRGGKMFMEGMSKILSCPEFYDIEKTKNFLSLLESKEKLVGMLQKGSAGSVELTIKIGSEFSGESEDFSVVTANYTLSGKSMATAGAIGPIRMDYGKVVSVLECIRSIIEEMLKK